ncbi:hypothetical protein [Ottowia sp.]|uniref:hypothetical protein n=1 Tax=Ottowia sp. TaxID=1898956 RepID=UPI002C705AA3|nr:hypothetical protein [Ottowia sp.]HOB66797.1 hypothetical protein [Ottowia sp.]HPZ57813.1 hypothetical protein [Ottowia sp.]HQD47009.1 hypothetical protein [Ottowia sp.]
MDPSFKRFCISALSIIALTGTACGGGDAESAPPLARGDLTIAATLLDNEGEPMLPSRDAIPTDAAAQPRLGLYATPEQADMLRSAGGQDITDVNVECCGREAIDRALRTVWSRQAPDGLPGGKPVLVRGTDLRLAATVVNELAAGGLTRVFLVNTP